ncbi:MAG: PKD domain-containing protein [Bacteroidota bacterium]
MKKYLYCILFFIGFSDAFAAHIVGGEVYYTYLGPGTAPNTSRYTITFRIFTECGQRCGAGTTVACPPVLPIISIFDNITPYNRVADLRLTKIAEPSIDLTTYPPCITDKPPVCYQVNTYQTQVELANTFTGYRMVYQNCCRQATLNVLSDAQSINGIPGAAYEAILPGTLTLPVGNNSSAIMDLKDTALVCHGNPFTLPFSATDADGDSLSYRFEAAYDGGSLGSNLEDSAADNPLYNVVRYRAGFSGTQPLGLTASISATTGIISGIAPAQSGAYVINVIVSEWRNGRRIAEHRKDFILEVEDCDIPSARLTPQDETCDGFTRHFTNQSNANVSSWYWDFGIDTTDSDTSILASPTFTYQDTGRFVIKLVVNRGTLCADSSTYNVWVYPGFFPGFDVLAPFCRNTPIQFIDSTRTNYGQVLNWRWHFGNANNDSSQQQNPTFIYTQPGNYKVRLDVSNSYGCTGFWEETITVNNLPTLSVLPKDTTYCAVDSVQLRVTGTGTFNWLPSTNIIGANTTTPIVFPLSATKYFATITDANGCKATDSARLNPVNNVTNNITASATTICAEDTITLTGSSNYTSNVTWQWAPAALTQTPTGKITRAFPGGNTTFVLTTTWGKGCKATTTQDITVKVLAVPEAGNGGYICKAQTTLQLQASGGVSYQWTPTAGLSNPNIANPVASPSATTMYKVAVGVAGCNKTKTDSVQVEVKALPEADLFDDTLICSIDTLRLITNPAHNYVWTPNYMINNLTAKSPLVSPDVPTTYYTTLTDLFGCVNKDSVFVDVKLVVTIDAGPDTTICLTDTFHLRTVSDALSYQWSPATFLDRADAKNPLTSITDPIITYHVIGNIGKCQSRDSVTIRTAPYPVATINPDTSICFGENAKLYASGGSSYAWSPSTFLNTVNGANITVVKPSPGNYTYTVSVTDNKGCPKPATATTDIIVRQPVISNTGLKDTTIVIGQPLRMNASGGDAYLWSPTQWLSDPTSPTTVASPENDITYKVTVTQLPENCSATDTVRIKVYLLPPSFYVPTAFSPNGDGLNEVLRPIMLGMRNLRYFKVYNRLGNLVFETTEIGKGWDGYYKGNPQDPGNYVWMAQGETWKGEFITRKGNAVLVR